MFDRTFKILLQSSGWFLFSLSKTCTPHSAHRKACSCETIHSPDSIDIFARHRSNRNTSEEMAVSTPRAASSTVYSSSSSPHFLRAQDSSSQAQKERKIFNCKQSCAMKYVKRLQSAFLKPKFIFHCPTKLTEDG